MPTLLIVDDHGAFRALAREALSERFDVIGEAADGGRALALAQELRPDVVLLDVHLPDIDGFAVARSLAAGDDPPAVVLTSSRDQRDFRQLLDGCPVRGFIEKERVSAAALAALLER